MTGNSDRRFDKIMQENIKIFRYRIRIVDLVFILTIMLLGMLVRKQFLDYESRDWTLFLSVWTSTIKENGGFKALGEPIGNYTSSYMYLLTLLTYTRLTMLHAVKYLSIVFDYIAAIVGFFIVYEITKNKFKSIIAIATIIFLPSVIINGAMWGQCDIIYSTFILLSLYFLIKERDVWSIFFFAVAFTFKIQSVFFLPVLLIMWSKNKVKFRYFAMVPAVYFASILPEWILGRSLKDLLLIYFNQTGTYENLSLGYPNVYQIIGEVYREALGKAGVFFTIGMLGILAYWIYQKKIRITSEFILTLSLFTIMIVTFLMPHMHERYGFLAEIIVILYALMNTKKIWLAITLNLISIVSYITSLAGWHAFVLNYLALVMGVLIIIVGYDLYEVINKNSIQTEALELGGK